jgi:hypothetical protein
MIGGNDPIEIYGNLRDYTKTYGVCPEGNLDDLINLKMVKKKSPPNFMVTKNPNSFLESFR